MHLHVHLPPPPLLLLLPPRLLQQQLHLAHCLGLVGRRRTWTCVGLELAQERGAPAVGPAGDCLQLLAACRVAALHTSAGGQGAAAACDVVGVVLHRSRAQLLGKGNGGVGGPEVPPTGLGGAVHREVVHTGGVGTPLLLLLLPHGQVVAY
jgi:hypothetical protein